MPNDEFRPPHWSQFLGFNLKRAALVLVGLLLAAIAFHFGHRHYQARKVARLATLATESLAKGDYRAAVLQARQALQNAPHNLPATKVIARIAEEAGNPEVVAWRRRLVELQPGNLDALLDWAASALRFGDLHTADQAFAQARDAADKSARFHELRGGFWTVAKRPASAEFHFAKARALEPDNPRHQLNLAMAQLANGDTNRLAEARASLASLESRGYESVKILRALRDDSLRAKRPGEALAHSARLITAESVVFPDMLEHLAILRSLDPGDYAAYLVKLQARAARDADEAATLIGWLHSRGQGREAWRWAGELPFNLKQSGQVRLALAETWVSLKEWKQIESVLGGENWGDFEFLRLAFLARVALETGERQRRNELWKSAVAHAGQNPASLNVLANMMAGWGWLPEAENLWSILAGLPGKYQRPALAALHRLYVRRKDEPMLLRTATRILELDPRDVVARNNWAQLVMYQGKGIEKSRAHATARELHERLPASLGLRATYAFALWQQDRAAEALALFKDAPKDQLEDPSIAVCYGLVLAANGRHDEARRYLKIAQTSPALLPSEQRLVARALEGLP